MTDIENAVYTAVAKAARAVVPGIYTSGIYENDPKQIPAMYFCEENNLTHSRSATLDSRENHADITYQGFIYAKDKQTAKSIAGAVDETMLEMGFTRLMNQFVPNVDRTICRVALRYTAVVSAKGIDGAADTHLIYTR